MSLNAAPPPLLTPAPKPQAGVGIFAALLLVVALAQAVYIIHSHSAAHASTQLRAVITDARGNEPSRVVKPGKLLTLSSSRSGAASSRWSVDPPNVEYGTSGTDIHIVVPTTSFSVRLLVVKGDAIDEAVDTFNAGEAPLPQPGPSPLPGPLPQPGPTPSTPVAAAAIAYKTAMAAAFHKAGDDLAAGKATKANYDKIIDAGVDGPSKALAAALDAAEGTSAALHQVGDIIGGK
jgi:hypothetical protein